MKRQPAPPQGGPQLSSAEPDSSTILKKCWTFSDPTLDSAHLQKVASLCASFFNFCSFDGHADTGPERPCYNSAFPFMAIISPFRAWRYDPGRVPVQRAVTQPYDKITPALQEGYYQASPYNLVRIILGKRLPEDGEGENVYTRAAASFQSWRQAGILKRDAEPSIYRYTQTFELPSGVLTTTPGNREQAERQGFIALGGIENYSAGVVFRHEQTLAKPKADRLDLLRATRSHFGQIFMLYEH